MIGKREGRIGRRVNQVQLDDLAIQLGDQHRSPRAQPPRE
jgi:hypothetical protein